MALDLLLFFVFFEAMLVPMYLLIGGWGGERRDLRGGQVLPVHDGRARRSCCVAILFLYSQLGRRARRGHTFDLRALVEVAGSLPVATAAVAVPRRSSSRSRSRCPLFPLHTWLPDAHTEAPTAGSVLLAAVLLKVGTYGLIRFNLALFPEAVEVLRDVRLDPGGDRHHLRRGRAR